MSARPSALCLPLLKRCDAVGVTLGGDACPLDLEHGLGQRSLSPRRALGSRLGLDGIPFFCVEACENMVGMFPPESIVLRSLGGRSLLGRLNRSLSRPLSALLHVSGKILPEPAETLHVESGFLSLRERVVDERGHVLEAHLSEQLLGGLNIL